MSKIFHQHYFVPNYFLSLRAVPRVGGTWGKINYRATLHSKINNKKVQKAPAAAFPSRDAPTPVATVPVIASPGRSPFRTSLVTIRVSFGKFILHIEKVYSKLQFFLFKKFENIELDNIQLWRLRVRFINGSEVMVNYVFIHNFDYDMANPAQISQKLNKHIRK
jgi:hypothetical protein